MKLWQKLLVLFVVLFPFLLYIFHLAVRSDWVVYEELENFRFAPKHKPTKLEDLPPHALYLKLRDIQVEYEAFYDGLEEQGRKVLVDYSGSNVDQLDQDVLRRLFLNKNLAFIEKLADIPKYKKYIFPYSDFYDTDYAQNHHLSKLLNCLQLHMYVHGLHKDWKVVESDLAVLVTILGQFDQGLFWDRLSGSCGIVNTLDCLITLENKIPLPDTVVTEVSKACKFYKDDLVPYEEIMRLELILWLKMVDRMYDGGLKAPWPVGDMFDDLGGYWWLMGSNAENTKRNIREMFAVYINGGKPAFDLFVNIKRKSNEIGTFNCFFIEDPIGVLFASMFQSNLSMHGWGDSAMFKLEAFRLWVLLRRFAEDTGVPARSLDDLVPDYINSIPTWGDGGKCDYVLDGRKWWLLGMKLQSRELSQIKKGEYHKMAIPGQLD